MTTLKTKLEETKIAATDKVNEAKVKTQDKLHEAQEEASQALAQAQDTLHQTQTVANGRFTQAKGIAKEKLGQLTHNNALQRAGKVDQAKGYLQATYGHSWPVRHKGTVMAATALVALLTYLAHGSKVCRVTKAEMKSGEIRFTFRLNSHIAM